MIILSSYNNHLRKKLLTVMFENIFSVILQCYKFFKKSSITIYKLFNLIDCTISSKSKTNKIDSLD